MPDSPAGIPGARSVHHVAYTVPDLDQAVKFFTEIIGAELIYQIGPVQDTAGNWMERQLNVPAEAYANIAMLRLGLQMNLELFQYTAPGQNQVLPRNSDWGGHHLAIYVDDVDTAVAYLREQAGVAVHGKPQTIDEGPITGDRWVYFSTPWGMQMEVLHMPAGMPYERHTDARLAAPGASWGTR
jgi:catechol 2,3-dioxygenase-like lactoylglutathione lyase family enzyme